jgi:flagellar hook-associated protein 3 FlgL
MRITQSILLQSHASQIAAEYERLFDVQAQLSSGLRLQKPSDDPGAIRTALDVRSSLAALAQAGSNADLASADLSTADGMLQNASDLLSRAREIAVEASNGTVSASDRASMAAEVDGLLQQMVTLGNSRGTSGYLFGGSRRDAPPYVQIETAGGTSVSYQGDARSNQVDLGDGMQLGTTMAGSEVFAGGARGTTVYQGVTGAAAGSGNDALVGNDHLTVAHVQTVVGDGALGGTGDSASGLQIGASSAAGDTVLGPASAHTLTLVDTSGTGASGTVTLDDGTAVNWTSADQDLAVTAADGTVVHLDLSAVTAGFNGTVTVAGSGTMSLDGGATKTAISFSNANQVVVDSQTGATLFVDARAIHRAGSDLVREQGGSDVMGALIELRDALKNDDGLPDDQQVARIGATIDALTNGTDRVLAALAQVGAHQRFADATKARVTDLTQVLTKKQSDLEDVDFAAASVQFSQVQLALQAGLQVTAKVMQMPTLASFL